MEKQNFTRLTLEQVGKEPEDNIKLVWEVPYLDVTAGDMIDAFKTIMVGMTFNPESIATFFVRWLEENSNYVIYKKPDNYQEEEDNQYYNFIDNINYDIKNDNTIKNMQIDQNDSYDKFTYTSTK